MYACMYVCMCLGQALYASRTVSQLWLKVLALGTYLCMAPMEIHVGSPLDRGNRELKPWVWLGAPWAPRMLEHGSSLKAARRYQGCVLGWDLRAP